MSMLPAAPIWAGNHRGIRAVGTSFAIGALSLFAAHSAFAGESATNVLKKMADNYSKAKSYQVSITTIQAGKDPKGKPFTVTQTEHIQYQSPNMFHKSVKATATGPAVTGQFSEELAKRQGEIFSDGKTATMYVPARKMYQKQPVPPNVVIAQLVDLLRLVPGTTRPGIVLLPNTATVNGRQAYIIELKPTPPAKAKPDEMKKYNETIKQFKQYPRFMIDKQNYNLLEYTLSTTTATAHVDLTSQVFGGAIPANTFAFTPPAGAKEFKPTPGAPGGPGMPPGGGVVPPGGKPK